MGVQPASPPGVHKLKLIKSLLKALQSLSLFASPVFQSKELILATLVSWPVALLKLLIFELIFSLLNSLLISWIFDIVSELRVGICIYIIYSLFVIILLVILLLYIGIWSINSKIHSKITENNDAKIVDFSEDRGHFTGNFTGQITSNIEITLKINSKIKENGNENDKDLNKETNEKIDEVLVSYFKSPKSYTTEDMCEINSHGGIVVEKEILELCIKKGAILAEPGEFTKRSFLNGRKD